MSADKINIAIAKWMGWKEISWDELTNPREALEQKLFCLDTSEHICGWLPNFCGDLNAMALAEANVPYDIQPYLLRELKRSVMNYETGVSEWDCYVATALQRAQALVKTLNLPIE